MAFAFEDRKKEREYGTYIIPGLKATQTLLTSEGDMPAMCTTMTPQGLAVTEDYVFVSAYCHAKKHNSVNLYDQQRIAPFYKRNYFARTATCWRSGVMTVNIRFCGILQIRRSLPRQ